MELSIKNVTASDTDLHGPVKKIEICLPYFFFKGYGDSWLTSILSRQKHLYLFTIVITDEKVVFDGDLALCAFNEEHSQQYIALNRTLYAWEHGDIAPPSQIHTFFALFKSKHVISDTGMVLDMCRQDLKYQRLTEKLFTTVPQKATEAFVPDICFEISQVLGQYIDRSGKSPFMAATMKFSQEYGDFTDFGTSTAKIASGNADIMVDISVNVESEGLLLPGNSKWSGQPLFKNSDINIL